MLPQTDDTACVLTVLMLLMAWHASATLGLLFDPPLYRQCPKWILVDVTCQDK